jgi:hypothetical protein
MPSEGRGILSPVQGRFQATQRAQAIDSSTSVAARKRHESPAVGHTFGHTRGHIQPAIRKPEIGCGNAPPRDPSGCSTGGNLRALQEVDE